MFDVIIASGCVPAIQIFGIPKRSYSTLTVAQRIQYSRYDKDWPTSFVVYYDCDVKYSSVNAIVKRYTKRARFDKLADALDSVTQSVIMPLTTAVYVYQFGENIRNCDKERVYGAVTVEGGPTYDIHAKTVVVTDGETREIITEKVFTDTDFFAYCQRNMHDGGRWLHTTDCFEQDRPIKNMRDYVGTNITPLDRQLTGDQILVRNVCQGERDAFVRGEVEEGRPQMSSTIGRVSYFGPAFFSTLLPIVQLRPQMFKMNVMPDSLINRVNRTLDDVQSDFHDTTEAIRKTTHNANEVLSEVHGIAASLKNITTAFGDFMAKTFPEYIDNCATDAILFLDFVRAMNNSDMYLFGVSCIRLLTRFKLAKHVIHGFQNLLSGSQSIVSNEPFLGTKEEGLLTIGERRIMEVKAQGHEDSNAGSIFFALMGALLTRALPSKHATKDAMEFCRAFNTMVPTAKNLRELSSSLTDYLPAVCNSWIATICPPFAWETFIKFEYMAFHERVVALNVPDNQKKLKYDKVVQEELVELEKKARVYITTMLNKPQISPKFAAFFRDDCKILETLRELVEVARGESAFRRVPFCFTLYGPPNQGKSLMSILLCKLLRPDGWGDENLIYCFADDSEFWDCYNGQFAVIFDDAWAFNDADTVKMARAFLTLVSNIPKGLNMASLNDPKIGIKGMKFSSEVIGLSTNVPFLNLIGMQNYNALDRRRNFLLEVSVKPEFVNQVSKKVMYGDISELDQDELSYIRWRFHDPEDRRENAYLFDGKYFESQEVMKIMLHAYINHRKEQDVLLQRQKTNKMIERVRGEFGLKGKNEISLRPQMYVKETEGDMHFVVPAVKHFESPLSYEERVEHQFDVQRMKTYYSYFEREAPRIDAPNVLERLQFERERAIDQRVNLAMHEGLATGILPSNDERQFGVGIKVIPSEPSVSIMENVDLAMRAAFMKPELINRFIDPREKNVQSLTNLFDEVKNAVIPVTNVDWLWSYVYDLKLMVEEFMKDNPLISSICTFVTGFTAIYGLFKLASFVVTGVKQQYTDIVDDLTSRFVYPNVYCNECDCFDPEVNIPELKKIECKCRCHGRAQAAAGHGYEPTGRAERMQRRVNLQRNFRARMNARPQQFENFLKELEIDYNPGSPEMLADQYVPYMAHLKMPSVGNRALTCYRFAGTFILLPKHFFLYENGYVPELTPFTVHIPFGPYFEMCFEKRFVHEFEPFDNRERDVLVYDLGPRIPAAPSRWKHFMSIDDYGQHNEQAGALLTTRKQQYDGKEVIVSVNLMLPKIYYEDRLMGAYQANQTTSKQFYNTNCYAYFAPTIDGDCGALAVGLGKNTNRRILGIHVGIIDKTGRGFTEPVFLEELERFKPTHQGPLCKPSFVSDADPVILRIEGQSFSTIGRVAIPDQIYIPTKTELVPSPYFEMLGPHTKEPSILSPHDKRHCRGQGYSPLSNGLHKYSKQSGYFESEIIDICFERAKKYWGEAKYYHGMPSMHVVINGDEKKMYMKSLDFSTSAGYPWCKRLREGASTKKSTLFSGVPGFRFIEDKLLIERLNKRRVLAKQGIQFEESIFVTNCKDELRPIAKIKEGKTRVFECGSTDFTILCREYGLPFFNDFYGSFRSTPSAVGMDCESGDWHDMCSYLFSVSDMGCGGDFGRFDGTLSAQMMWKFGELWKHHMQHCKEWQEECGDLVVNTLMGEIIHTSQLAFDGVYVAHGGNPSGNPTTVLINTFVNWMYLAYCWMKLAPPSMQTMDSFEKNVHIKAYGDDNIFSVSTASQQFYNMKTISQMLANYGIEYLPPTKTDVTFEICPLRDLTFLKRRIVTHKEIGVLYYGEIEYDTIQNIIDYNRKSCSPKFAVAEVNLNMALRFAFFHGKIFFDSLRGKMLYWAKEHDYPVPSLLTFGELLRTYTIHGCIMEEGIELGKAQMSDDESVTNWGLKDQLSFKVAQKRLIEENKRENAKPQMQQPGVGTLTPGAAGDLGGVMAAAAPVIEGTPTLGSIILQPEPSAHAPITAHQPFARARAMAIMPEQPWDLAKMSEKLSPVSTFVWAPSDTRFTLKKQFLIPFDLLTTNTQDVPFSNFTFTRFHTKFTATTNGPATSQGALLINFVPGMNKVEAAARHANNLCAATIVPNFQLGPNHSSGDFEIPFYNINSYMNLANPNPDVDFVGTINIFVLSPLFSDPSSSTPNVDVTCYVSFKESLFHLPQTVVMTRKMNKEGFPESVRPMYRKPGTLMRIDSESEYSVLEDEDETIAEVQRRYPHLRIERARPQGSSSSKQEEDQSRTTTATSGSNNRTTGNITVVKGDYVQETIYRNTAEEKKDPFVKVPPISIDASGNNSAGNQSATNTTKQSADVDASEGKMGGGNKGEMDKPPTVFRVPQQEVNDATLAQGVGINYAVRMDLEQRSIQVSDHEHFATAEDEMHLRSLWQRMGYSTAITLPVSASTHNFISLPDTAPPGTILAQGFITPVPELYDPNISIAVNGTGYSIYMSNLSYLTAKANFWTGGLKYRFQFYCTEAHTAQLVFTPHYGTYLVPTDLGAAVSQYSTYFKLGEGNTSFEVEVPNIFQRHWQRVQHGATGALTSTAIGVWSLRVETPLNHPSIVHSAVEGIMYVGASENFRARGYYGNNKCLVPLRGQMEEGRAQASEPLVSGVVKHQAHLMTTGTLAAPDLTHFGATECDLHTILKRPSSMGIYTDTDFENSIENAGSIGKGFYPDEATSQWTYPRILGVHTSAQLFSHGLHGWFAPCYRYMRGSVQFQVYPYITQDYGGDPVTNSMNFSKTRTVTMVDASLSWFQLYNQEGSSTLPVPDPSRLAVPGTFAAIMGYGGTIGISGTAVFPNLAFPAPTGGNTPATCDSFQYVGTVSNEVGLWYGINGGVHAKATGYFTPPLTISKDTNDSHSIVVPHLTEYPILYVSQASQNCGTTPIGAQDINLVTHSSVVIALMNDTVNGFLTGETYPTIRAPYTLFGAIGDDFRFGGYLGPSKVEVYGLYAKSTICVPNTSAKSFNFVGDHYAGSST